MPTPAVTLSGRLVGLKSAPGRRQPRRNGQELPFDGARDVDRSINLLGDSQAAARQQIAL
jgi:hypothetical protein